MALIFDLDVSRRFGLDEYVDHVETEVDLRDFDSLAESGWALRALANDRKFLLDFYHDELRALLERRSANVLTPQSVVLVRKPRFFIRANVWLPPNPDPTQRDNERKLYAYDLPHDHNFDFVTVGYAGVGYVTDLYRYDVSKVVGHIGERVELEDLGRERLSPGRIMVYKANRDIHTQYEPEQISVSLNLIPLHDRLVKAPQFVFDPARGTIVGGVSDQVGSRLFLLDFFRHMHDRQSVDLLGTIAQRHPCPRTRGQALNVLEEIAPDAGEYFRSRVAPEALVYNRPDLVHAGYARQKGGV